MLFSSLKRCVCAALQWGLGPLWTENIPPSCNLCDPAVSLPTAIFFFLDSTHCIFLPHHADRHTHARAPTAPVAPPRLLGVEQGDPGPMRQAPRGEGGATRGEPALVQPSEALLVRVTDPR